MLFRSSEKTGDLVSAKLTDAGREILMITNEGIIIRINVDTISVLGRSASGVKLMNIDAASGVRVAKVTKMSKSEIAGNAEESSDIQNPVETDIQDDDTDNIE